MLKSIVSDLKIYAKDLTLLLAEDDVKLANEMRTTLKKFYKEVYVSTNGLEALEIYRQNHCDIVLCDLNMPDLDGVGLAKQIRILNKEQVIFVISGYIDNFVVELFDIGIQGLFVKPLKPNEFFQKLLVHSENVHLKNRMNSFKKINKTKTTVSSILEKSKKSSIYEYIDNFGKNSEIDDSLWNHISDDIYDLNHEFEECVNRITLNGMNEEIQENLVRIFSKYNNSILLIPQINQMSTIFNDLATTFEDLDRSIILNDDYNDAFNFLEFFYDDIINFFEVVFVNRKTENINYLTDSLNSSVIQLKTKLGLIEFQEEELELF